MTRTQRFLEEHGHSTETECAACKRRGDRVIYWSHNDCHVCEDRKDQARKIRMQRRVDRDPLFSFFKGLGDFYKMQAGIK